MTTTGRAGVILVVLAVLMPSGSALATERVSVDSSGAQANQFSFRSSISADGRFVAFESNASNLVAGDGNFSQDVFVRDRQSGTTELVSVGSSGNSSLPAISADGRFVAFANGPNVYVRDRQDNVTELVGPGFQSSISGDGRYVAFVSLDSLVPADTNSSYDVYVHDRDTDTTQLVSVDSLGNVGDGNSGTYNAVSISADGRLVAFSSQASNLVADDTNGQWDVFVHDRDTGTTERMSVDSSGNEGNPTGNYFGVSIDAAGRNVAFESDADNLVADDTNALVDVFVRDRQNGTTKLVSLDSSGGQATFGALDPSISGDGRFVAFRSASAMVPGDTNLTSDVFVRDLANDTTVQASVNGSGTGGNNYSQEPSLDNDGGLISYASDSTDLVAGDTNGATDVFVTDLSVPPPGPPTGVVAAAGDGSASVSWVAPTGPGSSTIDSYSVTPHDTTAGTDGAPVSSPSTSANAAGLTNGHIYTFTVTASGPGGTSADSASSNAVTPQAGYPQPASASGDASTTSSTTVSTGTDPSATGGTASSVTVPAGTAGGPVSIIQTGTTTSSPSGYSLLGQQVNITAPSGTPTNPLELVFALDAASLSAAGLDYTTVQVTRDGVPIAPCDALATGASPDPCVESRAPLDLLTLAGATLTILTSHASDWNFAATQSLCAKPVTPSTNTAFNKTSIGSGRYVWFNAAVAAAGLGKGPVTILVGNQTVQFRAGGTLYTLSLPESLITFAPSASTATTTFDPDTNAWHTTVPSKVGGNVFMGGFGYHVPVALPGGIKPVTWKATFSADRTGVSLEWQWSAAVYTSFDAPGLLGVKPVDDPKASAYKNSDRAGTPESFKRFVTAGAAGTGGKDYTGHGTPPTLVRPCV